jgi:uncharacterized membrane protein
MIREGLAARMEAVDSAGFRLRGRDVARFEGLTDGVFALAVTLLIVSTEVPRSFDELMKVVKALPAFAVCFAYLMWLWATHHTMCRRYGLNDRTMIVLNSVLLFVVLYYVYPLKFLYGVVMGQVWGGPRATLTDVQAAQLFVMYGAGFASVALVYVLMYAHALRQRERLGLNALEVVITKECIARMAALMGVALCSVVLALALSGRWVAVAGWVYALFAVTETGVGWMYGVKAEKVKKESAGPAQVATP